MTNPITVTMFDATSGAVTASQEWTHTTFRQFDSTGTVTAERPASLSERAAVALSSRTANAATIRTWLENAYQTNRTFLALGAAVSTLQLGAQVRALTQQNQRLIRLVADLLDGND